MDFDEFFARLEGSDGDQGKEAKLIAQLSSSVCLVEEITVCCITNHIWMCIVSSSLPYVM